MDRMVSMARGRVLTLLAREWFNVRRRPHERLPLVGDWLFRRRITTKFRNGFR